MDVDNAFPDFSKEKLRSIFDYLASIGEIALNRGYADWSELASKKQEAFEWNILTVNLFVRGIARKNAADIAIAVDAMEELYTVKEITTFVIIGGDSDLAPLATRLKEKGKEVIGISRKAVASKYFIKACSSFVYLDDLMPSPQRLSVEKKGKLSDVTAEFKKIVEEKIGKGKLITADSLKNLLLQSISGFDEKKYGFKTFIELLESLAEFEIIRSATGAISVRLVEDIEKVKGAENDLKEESMKISEEPMLPLSLEEARDILIRAITSSSKTDGRVDIARLKPIMLRMAPRFSEKELGHSKFIDFLATQKDLVKITHISPTHHLAELLKK